MRATAGGVLLIVVGFAVVATAAAYTLAARRDLGVGLVPVT